MATAEPSRLWLKISLKYLSHRPLMDALNPFPLMQEMKQKKDTSVIDSGLLFFVFWWAVQFNFCRCQSSLSCVWLFGGVNTCREKLFLKDNHSIVLWLHDQTLPVWINVWYPVSHLQGFKKLWHTWKTATQSVDDCQIVDFGEGHSLRLAFVFWLIGHFKDDRLSLWQWWMVWKNCTFINFSGEDFYGASFCIGMIKESL